MLCLFAYSCAGGVVILGRCCGVGIALCGTRCGIGLPGNDHSAAAAGRALEGGYVVSASAASTTAADPPLLPLPGASSAADCRRQLPLPAGTSSAGQAAALADADDAAAHRNQHHSGRVARRDRGIARPM